ncbi:MAG: hypothetical protein ACTSU4_03350 [Promethearchaeota archaeon]
MDNKKATRELLFIFFRQKEYRARSKFSKEKRSFIKTMNMELFDAIRIMDGGG